MFPNYLSYFKNYLGVRDFFESCMDTATIEERSVEDLKEIITRMGGWPVVEGSAWKEDNFKWWDLSMRAAEEGFGTDRMISIGKMFLKPDAKKFKDNIINMSMF